MPNGAAPAAAHQAAPARATAPPHAGREEARQTDQFESTRSLQRTIGNHATGRVVQVLGSRHAASRGGGFPLPPSIRAEMDAHFGADFSAVRIHTGHAAERSARTYEAVAYTSGVDIILGPGGESPDTAAGKRLLAHELAHVVQSTKAGPADFGDSISRAGGIDERDADAAAAAVAAGRAVPALRPAHASILRQAAPAAATAPTGLELPKNASMSDIVERMRVIDAIRPAPAPSVLNVTTFRGQEIQLTDEQVSQVRSAARSSLQGALEAAVTRSSDAIERYRAQEKINKDFWFTSHAVKAWAWISSAGDYENPGGYLSFQSVLVDNNAALARAALAGGAFAMAVNHVAAADAASERASKIVRAYIDQLIEGGEGLVTGLTFTKNAAFITVGVLAVVVSGGAALGLEAGTIGTGVGGLTVAQTATAISVGAPIVANLGEAGVKVALGDKVDWGKLAVDTATSIVLARFGGQLSAGIAGKIVGNPATATLARQAVASLVSGGATHVVSQAFTTSVDAVYRKLRGEDVTWEVYVGTLTNSLTDPTGWFMTALGAGVHTAGQAKVSAALRSQQPPPAATKPPAASSAKSSAPPPAPAAGSKPSGSRPPSGQETGTSAPGPGTTTQPAPPRSAQERAEALASRGVVIRRPASKPTAPGAEGTGAPSPKPATTPEPPTAGEPSRPARPSRNKGSYTEGHEGTSPGRKPAPEPEVETRPPLKTPRRSGMELSDSDRAMMAESERATARLGKPLKVKTKAAAEDEAAPVRRSGSGKRGSGPALTKKVMETGKEIGHDFAQNSSIDNGVPGQSAASHAEKVAAVSNPGRPLAVDRPMCPDCTAFFARLAAARRTTLVVEEPGGHRQLFRPDGARVVVTPNGKMVYRTDGSVGAEPD